MRQRIPARCHASIALHSHSQTLSAAVTPLQSALRDGEAEAAGVKPEHPLPQQMAPERRCQSAAPASFQ